VALMIVSYQVSPYITALVSPLLVWAVVQMIISGAELECLPETATITPD
jgi:hypothetical protein